MTESGDAEAGASGGAGSKILPVETGDVSPVEEDEGYTNPQVPDLWLPKTEALIGAAQEAAQELSERLGDLVGDKFEPIDGVRFRTVELDGMVAVVEVKIMLRNK